MRSSRRRKPFRKGKRSAPLHGEEAGKEIGPERQSDKPGADDDEHGATPSFDLLRSRFQESNRARLGKPNQQGQAKHERGHRQGGREKGSEGGATPAADERVPGQTGQDRPGSAKSGQDVAKAEEGKGQRRPLAAQARLGLYQGPGERVNVVAPGRDSPPL